jgi:hypothetical protein
MEIRVLVTLGLESGPFKFGVAHDAPNRITVCVGPESKYHADIASAVGVFEAFCLGGGHCKMVSMVSQTSPYHGLELYSFSTAFGGVPHEVQDAIREKLFALSNGDFANLAGYADLPKDLAKWDAVLGLLNKAE